METLEAARNMQALDVKVQHEATQNGHGRFPRLPRSISVFVAAQRPEVEAVPNPAADPALATLDRVLQELAAMRDCPAYVNMLFPESLYDPGQLTIRVVTGEAHGIEQHAIHEAQRQGLHVDLVVPDKLRASSRSPARRSVALGCPRKVLRETDGPDAIRDELALRYADMLVAVWDGLQQRGSAGRIARLIQHAVEAGLPVLWIDTMGATRKVAEALVTDHRLYQLSRPESEEGLLKSLFEDCDLKDGVVIEPLQRRLNPLQDKLVVPNRETSMLALYAAERSKHAWLEARAGFLHNVMEAVFSFDLKKLVHSFVKLARGAGTEKNEARDTESVDEPSSAANAQDTSGDLHLHFSWTDTRATFAGEKHRSAIWLLYMFSATAVLASVCGILAGEKGRNGWGPWIEIALIGSVIIVYWHARRRRWHRFWLGHRFMAEQFRYLQVLQPFLAVPGPFQEPLFVHSDSSGGAHRLRSAELWILQRVLSAVGLPTSYQHYEFANADRRMLACRLLASIDDQLVFHKRSYKSAKRLREMLEKIATWLFFLAALFTVLHVVDVKYLSGQLLHSVHTTIAIVCTASPAFAAALHGVMTKLETGRVATQAAQVRTRLFVLRTAVSTAMESVAPVDWFSMARLRDDAMEVAMLLSRENERWRDLIRYQETELPA
jgi:hypothetical protein